MNQIRWVALVIAILMALVATSQAHAAKPGAPTPDKGKSVPAGAFSQLKAQVKRQAERIKVLEAHVGWYDYCTPTIMDVGQVLDVVVSPYLAGAVWVPMSRSGLYTLMVDSECVDLGSESQSLKSATPVAPVLPRQLP